MDSAVRWILFCLVVCSVGVTTRSLEDYYNYNDYNDESLYQRSQTRQQDEEIKNSIEIEMPHVHPEKVRLLPCLKLHFIT